ncbi:hypothetical protein IWX49DRAFT_257266 [Phyllosticta citricarpa]
MHGKASDCFTLEQLRPPIFKSNDTLDPPAATVDGSCLGAVVGVDECFLDVAEILRGINSFIAQFSSLSYGRKGFIQSQSVPQHHEEPKRATRSEAVAKSISYPATQSSSSSSSNSPVHTIDGQEICNTCGKKRYAASGKSAPEGTTCAKPGCGRFLPPSDREHPRKYKDDQGDFVGYKCGNCVKLESLVALPPGSRCYHGSCNDELSPSELVGKHKCRDIEGNVVGCVCLPCCNRTIPVRDDEGNTTGHSCSKCTKIELEAQLKDPDCRFHHEKCNKILTSFLLLLSFFFFPSFSFLLFLSFFFFPSFSFLLFLFLIHYDVCLQRRFSSSSFSIGIRTSRR